MTDEQLQEIREQIDGLFTHLKKPDMRRIMQEINRLRKGEVREEWRGLYEYNWPTDGWKSGITATVQDRELIIGFLRLPEYRNVRIQHRTVTTGEWREWEP